MQGWIKLHRKIMEWEWYSDINCSRLFIHMLLKANHEEKKWRGYTIKKGTFVTSIKHLSEETGLTQSQVRTCLNKLKSTSEIAIKTSNKFSFISMVNYHLYQVDSKQTDNQISLESQASSNQIATNKNEKNEKNTDTSSEVKKNVIREKVILETWNKFGFTQHKGITSSAKKNILKSYKLSNRLDTNINDWACNYLVNGFKRFIDYRNSQFVNDKSNWKANLEYAFRPTVYEEVKNTEIPQ